MFKLIFPCYPIRICSFTGGDDKSPANHASRSELLDSEIISAEDEDVDGDSETGNEAFDSDEEDKLEGCPGANGAGKDYMRSNLLST